MFSRGGVFVYIPDCSLFSFFPPAPGHGYRERHHVPTAKGGLSPKMKGGVGVGNPPSKAVRNLVLWCVVVPLSLRGVIKLSKSRLGGGGSDTGGITVPFQVTALVHVGGRTLNRLSSLRISTGKASEMSVDL